MHPESKFQERGNIEIYALQDSQRLDSCSEARAGPFRCGAQSKTKARDPSEQWFYDVIVFSQPCSTTMVGRTCKALARELSMFANRRNASLVLTRGLFVNNEICKLLFLLISRAQDVSGKSEQSTWTLWRGPPMQLLRLKAGPEWRNESGTERNSGKTCGSANPRTWPKWSALQSKSLWVKHASNNIRKPSFLLSLRIQ